MIKLELPIKPYKLTPEFQAAKTQEFRDTGNSVWNIPWLKEAVFNMSYGKCCYSEIRLGEESKYMEIEHFQPKKQYPNEVMQWGNLLPSCKTCNGTKGEHDTLTEPIVNPFLDNPKDYFYLKDCFYFPKNKNTIAIRTIRKLALNNISHFVTPRQRIEEVLIIGLNNRRIDFEHYQEVLIPIGRMKRLMDQGNRKKEYSALVSTTILKDENFIEIEQLLKEKNLWDVEFETLKLELVFCALL